MFKFRFEPLITIRDNILKECQAELAKAYEARRQLEELQNEIDTLLTNNIIEGRQMMLPGQQVNVNHLLGLRQQELFLRADYEKLAQNIKGIDEVIEMRRNAVILANRDLQIVEKLKEKRYEKYQQEERRKETVMMDDIARRAKNSVYTKHT
jgi:flagellar export protein FliJ